MWDGLRILSYLIHFIHAIVHIMNWTSDDDDDDDGTANDDNMKGSELHRTTF